MLPTDKLSVLITVKYYVLFFVAANYCTEETFRLAGTGSLCELLELICQKYGEEFRGKIFGRDGSMKSTAWLILNDKRIEPEHFHSILLRDGDQLIISSPLLVGG